MDDNRIVMIQDDGSEIEYTVIDSTVFQGSMYILVTDAPDGEDGICYVMKDISDPDDETATYECADGEEADALLEIFREQLDGELDIENG